MKTRRDFLQHTLAAGEVLGLAGTREILAAGLPLDPQPGARNAGPSPDSSLSIGFIIYPRMDQIDFTGPFEVLSRVPNATIHVLGRERGPIRDFNGLILTAEEPLADAPPLDVLVVPGGPGQQELMEDEAVLSFIRDREARARYVFSVCTGALICGAAGLLKGVRTTTHWASFEFLKYFGAIPVNERVVIDGKHISAAGVTAGIDGALNLASLLRGDRVAQEIQLEIEYAPEPPFQSGTPATAPPAVLEAVKAGIRGLTLQRTATARRVAAKLGVVVTD